MDAQRGAGRPRRPAFFGPAALDTFLAVLGHLPGLIHRESAHEVWIRGRPAIDGNHDRTPLDSLNAKLLLKGVPDRRTAVADHIKVEVPIPIHVGRRKGTSPGRRAEP